MMLFCIYLSKVGGDSPPRLKCWGGRVPLVPPCYGASAQRYISSYSSLFKLCKYVMLDNQAINYNFMHIYERFYCLLQLEQHLAFSNVR